MWNSEATVKYYGVNRHKEGKEGNNCKITRKKSENMQRREEKVKEK